MASYAHTPNVSGQWHDLHAHLANTARLARQFADEFGAGEIGYWAGILHDLGKFNWQFQEYLKVQVQFAEAASGPSNESKRHSHPGRRGK